MISKVYINYGRPVVDCPYGCNNAYLVKPGNTTGACTASDGCQVTFEIEVPDNMSELLTELDRRPHPRNRNWFPFDHPLAVRARLPMGQTVADLRAEFEMESEEE